MKDKEITFSSVFDRLKFTDENSLNKIKEAYDFALK